MEAPRRGTAKRADLQAGRDDLQTGPPEGPDVLPCVALSDAAATVLWQVGTLILPSRVMTTAEVTTLAGLWRDQQPVARQRAAALPADVADVEGLWRSRQRLRQLVARQRAAGLPAGSGRQLAASTHMWAPATPATSTLALGALPCAPLASTAASAAAAAAASEATSAAASSTSSRSSAGARTAAQGGGGAALHAAELVEEALLAAHASRCHRGCSATCLQGVFEDADSLPLETLPLANLTDLDLSIDHMDLDDFTADDLCIQTTLGGAALLPSWAPLTGGSAAMAVAAAVSAAALAAAPSSAPAPAPSRLMPARWRRRPTADGVSPKCQRLRLAPPQLLPGSQQPAPPGREITDCPLAVPTPEGTAAGLVQAASVRESSDVASTGAGPFFCARPPPLAAREAWELSRAVAVVACTPTPLTEADTALLHQLFGAGAASWQLGQQRPRPPAHSSKKEETAGQPGGPTLPSAPLSIRPCHE